MEYDDYIKALEDFYKKPKFDEGGISITMDELNQLYDEVYELDLLYSFLLYDVAIYKKMAKVSFNVFIPLRKTNKIDTEGSLKVGSVIHVSWHDYQRIITSQHDRYTSMVNLFNILQYKFDSPTIKIKNPINLKEDMPSLRKVDLIFKEESIKNKNFEAYDDLMKVFRYVKNNKNK